MSGIDRIGERIKGERLALKLTQRELADRVDVGVPHISKVEAGRENPSDELLEKIAKVFGLDPDELLLAAGRVPDEFVEKLAADPTKGLEFLRSLDWDT